MKVEYTHYHAPEEFCFVGTRHEQIVLDLAVSPSIYLRQIDFLFSIFLRPKIRCGKEHLATLVSGPDQEPEPIDWEYYRKGLSLPTNKPIDWYILDNKFHLTTFLEDDTKSNGYSSKELPWLPDIVKDFVLPAGFPGSVSDDYLEYMHVNLTQASTSDWAVGLDYSSGTTAAASAAAIRWVSKDGIGAIGRFFIGGRFGNLFDDDPKQWRMYADFIGSAGSIFDLTTPLYRAYFLPLASLGNLAK
ncbi:unnamed protein product [Lactuca virosa]|uniref:Protein root UVB sensitive/RUS domain-containing protein n=1 Tax=Lactuca virosa TaxID=75947 RepID=A0AAU9NRU5_9ASTR|nr:unnamed protein product [Lactuca virosa]